ncbi:MAG: hypothetical protein ABI169_09925 [Chitinophagaceae bacterium]
MHRSIFFLVFLQLFCWKGFAAPYYYQYNAGCAQAYKAYLSLRPAEGNRIVEQELIAHPYNLLPVYLADYDDFLTLLFNGDPEERKQREGHQDERIQRLSEGDDNQPWKRLALAGVHLHWAVIHVRYGEQLKAALAFRKSYLLLKENLRLFPSFAPNRMMYGVEEAIAGTIPDQYNWLMKIFGMRGNLDAGLAKINAYINASDTNDPLFDEALIYSVYIRFYLHAEKERAWKTVMDERHFNVRGNLLHAFVRANIALSYRKAEIAINTLKPLLALSEAQVYPVFYYEMACAQLLQLNHDCVANFQQFVTRNKGLLFSKDALEQTALSWYLQGNLPKAKNARAAILNNGSLNTDADRQAQRFAKGNDWPNPILLTARLLIDGGNPSEALTKLQNYSASNFPKLPDLLEYHFRLGRAFEDGHRDNDAVQAYQKVINLGRERTEYFAARAALQMGGIYEEHGQKGLAIKYFQTCLSMKHHDYQASIDQQAKAGLQRLE